MSFCPLFFSGMLIKFYRHFENNYATASTQNVKIISYNSLTVLA